MKTGDIYTIEMPKSNGHEQAGIRPAIIMQSEELNKKLPTVMIVPLTSQPAANKFPCTFVIKPEPENGLTMASVVLIFQLRAIDKKRLKHKIGSLSKEQLNEMYKYIKTLIEFP